MIRASAAPKVSSGLSPSLNSADLRYSSDVLEPSRSCSGCSMRILLADIARDESCFDGANRRLHILTASRNSATTLARWPASRVRRRASFALVADPLSWGCSVSRRLLNGPTPREVRFRSVSAAPKRPRQPSRFDPVCFDGGQFNYSDLLQQLPHGPILTLRQSNHRRPNSIRPWFSPRRRLRMIRLNAVASRAASIAHLGSAATYDGVRPASLAI